MQANENATWGAKRVANEARESMVPSHERRQSRDMFTALLTLIETDGLTWASRMTEMMREALQFEFDFQSM